MKKLQTILHILVGASLMSVAYPWITMPESRNQLAWGGLMGYFGLFIVIRSIYYNGYNEAQRELLGRPKPITWLPVNQVVRIRCVLFSSKKKVILTLELPGIEDAILVWTEMDAEHPPSSFVVGYWYCFAGGHLMPLPISKT